MTTRPHTPKPKAKMFGIRTTDQELRSWRAAAICEGIRDLSTWFRWLATKEIQRLQRRNIVMTATE